MKIGIATITIKCAARNRMTRETIIRIDHTTMVNLDKNGKPKALGKSSIEFKK